MKKPNTIGLGEYEDEDLIAELLNRRSGGAKELIDNPHIHNFVYLRKDTIFIHEPLNKTIEKQIFACIDCGTGLDVYDFESIKRTK